jgi:hypothetical protein
VERVKEVKRDSWASFKARRNTARMKQLRASISGARGGSGSGGATWRGEEGASRGREAAGAVQERHVARGRAARGSWGSGNGQRGRWGRRREKQREEGAGGRRGGPGCNFSEVQGLHYKAKLTFKP